MFEHMKNYEKLFEKVSKWLKPDTGLLFIHVFCHKNFPYEFKVKSSNNADWMARNFFTGGTMPAFDTFLFFQKHLAIQNTWMVNGVHYSKVRKINLHACGVRCCLRVRFSDTVSLKIVLKANDHQKDKPQAWE